MIEIVILVALVLLFCSPSILGAGVIGTWIASRGSRADVIANIARTMISQDITLTEIEAALNEEKTEQSKPENNKRGDVLRTLFSWLGGVLIFAGISVYIGMFWNSMGGTMHVLLTLGVGFMLYGLLLAALAENKYPKLILPLTILQAAFQTSGWLVAISEIFPPSGDVRKALLAVFFVMAVQQSLTFLRHRLTILAFLALTFAYGFLEVSLDMVGFSQRTIALLLGASLITISGELEKTAQRSLSAIGFLVGAFWFNGGLFLLISEHASTETSALITGISGFALSYGLQLSKRHPGLVASGYFLSSILIYSGVFELVRHSSLELLFPAVAVGMLYTCTLLRSRALLFTSVISILGFIGYYTDEHFANAVGWPIALVIMGAAFLGIGILTLKVKSKL